MNVPSSFFEQDINQVAAGVGFAVVVGVGNGFVLLLKSGNFGLEGCELLLGLLLPLFGNAAHLFCLGKLGF